MAVDWWAVGTNMAVAAGTFSAAAVALFVAVRDGRRLADERYEKVAAQARLITAHVEPTGIVITNNSGLAVLSVELSGLYGDRGSHWVRAEHGLLKAGESWSIEYPNKLAGFKPSFEFVDASGLRWSRMGNALPIRSPKPGTVATDDFRRSTGRRI